MSSPDAWQGGVDGLPRTLSLAPGTLDLMLRKLLIQMQMPVHLHMAVEEIDGAWGDLRTVAASSRGLR